MHLDDDRLIADTLDEAEMEHLEVCPRCWFERRIAQRFSETEVADIAAPEALTTWSLPGYDALRWGGQSKFGTLAQAVDATGKQVEIVWVDEAVADSLRSREAPLARPPHPSLPEIVKIALEGDEAIVIRELFVGRDLLESRTSFAAVLLQVIDAVMALHAVGAAHGSIRAGAVRVDDEGRVMLMDAGLQVGDAESDTRAMMALATRVSRMNDELDPLDGCTNLAEVRQILEKIAEGLGGRYVDKQALGAGGMGEVRRVADPTLARDMAMKILSPEMANDPTARSRFLQEAQLTAQLQHPGIPAVHEMGELPDGRPYYTMREVRGRTLQQRLDNGDPERELLALLLRACEAVSYAHGRKVIHRDLKPANVMSGEFGEVLVLDWGLARVLDDPDTSVQTSRVGSALSTMEGTVAGTPAYMAPEQARGELKALGPWTDVYALGAMLYRILAGSPPYRGISGAEVVELVVAGPPAPPPYAAGLGEICMRAMSRDPSSRFADAGALVAALSSWLDTLDKLERAAADWQARDRSSALLWQSSALVDYAALVADRSLLSETERDFLRASAERTAGSSFGRLILAAGATAAAFVGLLTWDFAFAERVSTWEQVQDLGVGPEPVGSLSDDPGRAHFQVYRRGRLGRVIRYEYRNGSGALTTFRPWMRSLFRHEPRDEQIGDCQFEVHYDSDGGYLGTTVRDAYDQVTWRYQVDRDGVGELVNRFGYTVGAQRGAAFLKVVDVAEEGRVEISFRTTAGRPAVALNHASGIHFTRGPDRRVSRRTWVDSVGQPFGPLPDLDIFDPRYRGGPATWEEERSESARVRRYLDTEGRPTPNSEGCDAERYTFDERGREVTWECLLGGELANSRDGTASHRSTRDHVGAVVATERFDAEGRPSFGRQGYVGIRRKFDENGRPVELVKTDEAGEPMEHAGMVIVRQGFSDRGDMLWWRGFDAEGQPVLGGPGQAGGLMEYDALGNQTRAVIIGLDNKPMLSRKGWAEQRFVYDNLGVATAWSYHDVAGGPAYNEKGIHRIEREYDERGNDIRTRFVGTDGENVTDYRGVSERQDTWDERGNRIGIAYFDTTGAPTMSSRGYSAMSMAYDAHGQPIEDRYLDVEGAAINGPGGSAIQRYEFDAQGRFLGPSFHDSSGNLTVNLQDGSSDVTLTYLDDGSVLASNVGPDGKPAPVRPFASSYLTTRDRLGNIIEVSNREADGTPLTGAEGWTTQRQTYDANGHILTQSTFDKKGEPMDGPYGYAELRHVRDRHGNSLEWTFYDENGAPTIHGPLGYARRVQSFDAAGRILSRAAFDIQGKPAIFPPTRRQTMHGHHRAETARDERGNAIRVSLFDAEGNPTDEAMGYASQEQDFDEFRNATETRYFDAVGAPAEHGDGYQRVVQSYDPQGRLIRAEYFTADGEPGRRGHPEQAVRVLERSLTGQVTDQKWL